MEGDVAEVFGSKVLIKTNKGQIFVSMAQMSDEELTRVLDFVTARQTSAWRESKSRVAKSVAGKLERLDGDKLVPFAFDERPEPDFYLVYFSAAWCGPCQRFTPELVEAYRRYQAFAPGRVELIFVSSDRSRDEQEGYVKKAGMPWPVLKYRKLGSAREIERWEGKGIPCLVAVTRNGDAMLHSYRGEEYLGPDYVLKACDAVLTEIAGKAEPVRRARHRLAVLEHLRAAAGGNAAVKPYLIALDPAKYGAISVPPFNTTLNVNEKGAVADVSFSDEVNRVLQPMLAADIQKWLFLPSVKGGRPVPQTVTVPIALGGLPTTAAR